MSTVTSIDEKRLQREADAKERFLNSPSTRENPILDDNEILTKLNLLRHIDDDHILKKVSLSIENTKFIAYPSSTAFMVMLSVFSGYASRMYKVSRNSHDRRGIPLGLYVVAEQPSGSGKDFPMNLINHVFDDAFNKFKKDAKKRLKDATNAKKDMDVKNPIQEVLDEYKAAESIVSSIGLYKLSISDATPAGLEKTLIDTQGFFILSSSEQSLINVLVGGLFSNGQSNNEVLLKGFDGEGVKVTRGGRESFDGLAGGSLTVFAQKGSFKKIFESSEQSGLHERIIKIAEPNRGGERDFINGKKFNWFLADELKTMLQPLLDSYFSEENLKEPKSFYDLSMLSVSENASNMIDRLSQEMEDMLKAGGLYYDCKTDMMGTLSKSNIQALKIASCLHLLSGNGGYYDDLIDDIHIESAINIVRDLMISYKSLMEREAISGDKAAYEKIITYLSKTGQLRTMRDITQNLKGVKPFTMPKSQAFIRNTIESMVESGILKIKFDERTQVNVVLIV